MLPRLTIAESGKRTVLIEPTIVLMVLQSSIVNRKSKIPSDQTTDCHRASGVASF